MITSLSSLPASLSSSTVFDIPTQETNVKTLEEETLRPDFWSDPLRAQHVMRQLTEINDRIETWRSFEQRTRELKDLFDLAEAEGDEELLTDVTSSVVELKAQLDELELSLALGGPYDSRYAIVAIHAGAGGTDSMDWAEMLLRMYLRWAERRGYSTAILDMTPGEEAGVKSVTLEVTGPYAYGYLRSERGVHRLVRLSPFDAAHARHTSFALLEVMPEADEVGDVAINPDDLRIDVFRASGSGGQNVQKNSTAVRITHIPTGIVVSCQNERSQHRNKEMALKVLTARLLELDIQRHAEEQARIKGQHVSAGWGNQIRSYVLHPYKMVKDHRSDYETSNAEAVLDGDLDPFIKAYQQATLGREGEGA